MSDPAHHAFRSPDMPPVASRPITPADPFVVSGLLWPDPHRPPRPGAITIARDEAGRGRIAEVISPNHPTAALPQADIDGLDPEGGADGPLLIVPGFIDAHFHVPQIRAIGYDGLELLDWLRDVIFPAEMAWADPVNAEADCRAMFTRMLRAGTLGGAGYLTSHATGPAAAARVLAAMPGGGLRLSLGRVLMDRECPSDLAHDPTDVAAALAAGAATRWIAPAQPGEDDAAPAARAPWSVNPRFAISCTDSTLAHARELAGNPPERLVQTHLAETAAECGRVGALFDADRDYLAVYERHGLVHPRALLAHAIHLDDSAWRRIAAARAVCVHCPTANLFLSAGSFDLPAARRHGVRVATGSDVAAGPDLAMPRVARAMIDNMKWRRMTGLSDRNDPGAAIPTPADAWQMITRDNADALGWSDAGRLECGAAADVLLLRPARLGIDVTDARHLAGRLIYGWEDRVIEWAIVNGIAADLR